MIRTLLLGALIWTGAQYALAAPGRGNRLTYLDSSDPYYVSLDFPKLVTPQWVGEPEVHAVVVLAIDDMRGHERWEAYLRPILERLKLIDGRAAASIMTNQIDPDEPHLQTWRQEGVSLEVHTIDHPCPLLAGGDFDKAKSTYDRCVDLMRSIPGNRPVAFRMPCCDSLNTPSPRFYAEIFNRTSPEGNHLAIDSSVFQIFTADDPQLSRNLVRDEDGRERFRKYLPFPSFVNTIENYPYPYVIGRLCWQFPCMVPSDWEAQNLHRPNNPRTVDDMCRALDATVVKRGTFNLVFHPHGWIRNDQIVQFIDYAQRTYGTRVKFLTFRECLDRLNRHLLGGQPLRATDGGDNGVRLLDLNHDGYVDVVIGNPQLRQTRLWSPESQTWTTGDFPVQVVEKSEAGETHAAGARFGVMRDNGHASMIVRSETQAGGWHFDGAGWVEAPALLDGLELDGQPIATSREARDTGVRLRDLDGDGRSEVIVGNDRRQACFRWDAGHSRWRQLPFSLPGGTQLVDAAGRDRGLRFVDIDEDGHDDVIYSNEQAFSLHLFSSMTDGWSRQVTAGKPGDENALPLITRQGANNGAWFHSRHMWVQNENTARLPDLVDRRAYNDLLADVEPTPKDPPAGLRSIRVKPGFRVELLAAEPLVMDPVHFDWGADGRLWVVEMADYPLGVDDRGKPGGRVRYLEDTDGDGRYDRSTLFLDGISYPTGVMAWREGVLVSCAPDIFYAEDTDGDGRADVRRKILTGFSEGNPQHLLNGFAWGLNNWVYGANGDSGGSVTSAMTGQTARIGGRDFRFQPDTGDFDTETGQTQFGRCRDDWGNWFGCNNSNPMYQFVLSDRYLRRNPHATSDGARHNVPQVPGNAPVYPVSRTVPRFNDFYQANRITSACSVMVFRSQLFGPEYYGNSFVCEPVHNLVHREIVSAEGVRFHSARAADEQQSEFLAASDNFFRPVTVRTGPDGALWVADMYRAVMEHPEWIPDEWQQRLDLRAGHDKGRIYRVYPVGKRPENVPRLDALRGAELVNLLKSPHGVLRDMAHQRLIQSADQAVVKSLKKLMVNSREAAARLHALCVLDGLGALDDEFLTRAMDDTNPGVRRHAVRLGEGRFNQSPALGHKAAALATDKDAHLRLQLACSLGQWSDPRAGAALATIGLNDGDDPFFRDAVLSSLTGGNLTQFVKTLVNEAPVSGPPAELIRRVASMAAVLDDDELLAAVLKLVIDGEPSDIDPWQMHAAAGLLDGLDRRGVSLPQLAASSHEKFAFAVDRIDEVFAHARRFALNMDVSLPERMAAVRLLGRGSDRRAEDIRALAGLLTPQSPPELLTAAVNALGRIDDPSAVDALLDGWSAHTPLVRSRILDLLLSREEGALALLDRLENGRLQSSEIDAARRGQLLAHRNAAIATRAADLFGRPSDSDRALVVRDFQPVLDLPADRLRGEAVFKKSCSVCHRIGEQGYDIGPDLTSLTDKSPRSLLVALLDPSRAVEAKYLNYTAITNQGLTHTGMLAEETGNSITLVAQENKREIIPRAELDELASAGKSMMPEGLEKDISGQDLADVIAYVSSLSLPRKLFAGNEPQLIRADAEGVLRLKSTNCEIYGKTLVLEPEKGNLGYWQSENDRAVWTIEAPRTGNYRVQIDYACHSDTAGQQFVLRSGEGRLTATVPSTGTWNYYRRIIVGELTLTAGRGQVVMHSAGPPRGALIDLMEVRLERKR